MRTTVVRGKSLAERAAEYAEPSERNGTVDCRLARRSREWRWLQDCQEVVVAHEIEPSEAEREHWRAWYEAPGRVVVQRVLSL